MQFPPPAEHGKMQHSVRSCISTSSCLVLMLKLAQNPPSQPGCHQIFKGTFACEMHEQHPPGDAKGRKAIKAMLTQNGAEAALLEPALLTSLVWEQRAQKCGDKAYTLHRARAGAFPAMDHSTDRFLKLQHFIPYKTAVYVANKPRTFMLLLCHTFILSLQDFLSSAQRQNNPQEHH